MRRDLTLLGTVFQDLNPIGMRLRIFTSNIILTATRLATQLNFNSHILFLLLILWGRKSVLQTKQGLINLLVQVQQTTTIIKDQTG